MKPIHQRQFFGLLLRGTTVIGAGSTIHCVSPVFAGIAEQTASRKKLNLKLRHRLETREGSGQYRVVEKNTKWDPSETALIICDMWDQHWCKGASARVAELAPRMNDFVSEARKRGVLIVHAPSSCMEPYQNHPGRKRAQAAPKAANLPDDIKDWCRKIPAEEKGKYPIDQTDGGCDCEPKCQTGSPWKRQFAAIRVSDEDTISDSGIEIWNLLEQRGIKNVMLVGVHTNMCVLGRPFGLRQMARHGKNTALVRDLTDTMYNSKAWPYVNHFAGTDLIVEHIEKYVCPTTTSVSLLGGTPFRFKEDRRTQVAQKR
ncbi:MAG: cysteine hydrolase family protein [Verrucomicrobia bacterium]|nr:cysteine hydrolase family protein [Verrucomicrobiota bacterium]